MTMASWDVSWMAPVYFPDYCSNTRFQCNNGACILESKVCDSIADCADSEDELNCRKTGLFSLLFTSIKFTIEQNTEMLTPKPETNELRSKMFLMQEFCDSPRDNK